MDIKKLSDGGLLHLYENIRQQVAADLSLGSRRRLLGDAAKQRAERLRKELERRRLRYTPIDWR
jgi:hypothetical protein